MSEKITEKTVEAKERTYEFFCDTCGQKIMESVEQNDGYVESPLATGYSIYLKYYPGISYPIENKHILCEKCHRELTDKIKEALEPLGFERTSLSSLQKKKAPPELWAMV
ncbi:hypothetical protein FACS189479_05720 [Spirochaetia bacterium]|nr:hypothetical protein FACS189479_05720 [Spirochaetia bacterium]